MPIIVPRFRKGLGGILGLITGAVQGAFVGIMAVAFVGAVLGGIVGVLFRRLLGGTNGRFFHIFPGAYDVCRCMWRGSPGVLSGPCRGDEWALASGL